MSRSAVLTGRIDARDRAKLRNRLDRGKPAGRDPHEEIRAWLEGSKYRDVASEDMARLDLDEYLVRTASIELPPEERLRQLAMFVESSFGSSDPSALDRIYEVALRFNDADHYLWHSAKYSANGAATDETVARFRTLSLRCLCRAWELEPRDAWVAYSLGRWHYDFGAATEDAAEWFETVLGLEPEYGYALLYRAHGLHDRGQWRKAVTAYEAVPLETFKGPKAWLVDVVQEALAYCRLRAGDRQGAIADFDKLLTRFEKEPRRAEMLALVYLSKACSGPLRKELRPKYLPLARALGLRA